VGELPGHVLHDLGAAVDAQYLDAFVDKFLGQRSAEPAQADDGDTAGVPAR
jgi:hypothetical protein